MGEKFSFNTEIDLTEIEVEVKVTHFIPYRPAPACSNPDSPKFSDSGDDEEMEYDLSFVCRDYNKTIIKTIPFPDELYEFIDLQLVEQQIRENINETKKSQRAN